MSSMHNHRRRSHRSEKAKRDALGGMIRKNWIRPVYRPCRTVNPFRALMAMMGRNRESRESGQLEAEG